MISPARTAGGRQATWTRDTIIEALRRYAELYGPGFTAAAFSPSAAKWSDQPEWIDRYYSGDPETGAPWPSLNAIKSFFDGSFNAAREAAGFPANRPGPARSRRPAGEHKPIRNVSHANATRVIYVEKDSDSEALRSELRRTKERLARAEARGGKTKTVTKVKTRRVEDRAAVRRLERALTRAVKTAEELRAGTAGLETVKAAAEAASKEARAAATRMAARLERAEATITDLRADRRSVKRERDRLEDRLTAARRELAEREVETRTEVEIVEKVIREKSPEAAVLRDAEKETAAANRRASEAEVRAAAAEREYRELVSAVTGEPRKLTVTELRDLNARGPAGPVILAGALKALGKVRASGTKTELAVALTTVARAAISWRERL